MSLASTIEREGFALVEGLLSSEEIAELRRLVANHFALHHGRRFGLGRTQPNAALLVSGLANTICSPKVIAKMQEALGSSEILFTWHADAHMNMLADWHKDCGDGQGGYFRDPDFMQAETCKVYKMGIYLQDHLQDGRGLSVHKGSHHTPLGHGETATLNTKAGDVIIFDVRIDHRGQPFDPFERLIYNVNFLSKGLKRNRQDIRPIVAIKDLYWKIRAIESKMSVFFTYGLSNDWTQDFSYFNLQRQLQQTNQSLDPDVMDDIRKRLLARGIRAFDMANYHPA